MRASLSLLVLLLAHGAYADDETPPATTTPATTTPATTPATMESPAHVDEKPEPTVESKPDATIPKATEGTAQAPQKNGVDCPKGTLLCWKNDVVAVWPKLRVRPGFEYIDADPQILYIGENDGFFLDSARIGVEGDVSDIVRFKLTVEAASLLPGAQPNQSVTPILAAARDAWVAWTPSQLFIVQAGQQVMPSDYEGGDVEALLPFTHKSVVAGGVRSGEGNFVAGLSPARQVGIVIGSADKLKLADLPVEYRLGISNGNGINQLGNDNKLPAAYLRLGAGFGDLVRVGVGGRFNPRTVGTLPNLYTESDVVAFADLSLSVAGLSAVIEGEFRDTALNTLFPDQSNPAGQETSSGGALWLGYSIDMSKDLGFAVTPAYRISFYDPSSSFQTDQLLENTLGVRIDGDPARMPLSFLIDYTILTELGDVAHNLTARDIADNRLTALFQIEL